MWCAYVGVSVFTSVIEVLENALKIHQDKDHRAYKMHKYVLVRFLSKEVKYWSDFSQIFR